MATNLYLRTDQPYFNEGNTWGVNGAELSTALPVGTFNGAASADRRRMLLPKPGTADVDRTFSTRAQTADQDNYLAKYISLPLQAQTISANTWTIALFLAESNSSANAFLVLSVYVYRPSTKAVVGYVYDSHTALGVEWNSAGGAGQVITFSGSAVTVEDGDVLCLEVWEHATQQMSTGYIVTWGFNGATDVTAGGAGRGSYLSTPQDLSFLEQWRLVGLEMGDDASAETFNDETTGGTVTLESAVVYTGRFSRKHAVGGTAARAYTLLRFPTDQANHTFEKLFASSRIRVSSLSAYGSTGQLGPMGVRIAYAFDSSGLQVAAAMIGIGLKSDGTFTLTRTIGGTTTVLATSSATLAADTWYVFQIDVPDRGASVTVKARVYSADGGTLLEELSASADTATQESGGADQFKHPLFVGPCVQEGQTVASVDCYWDDAIVRTEAAPDPRLKLYVLNPDGNGGFTAWTNDYTAVDDMLTQTDPDALGDQVTETTVGDRESFTMDNPVPSATPGIECVHPVFRVARGGAADGEFYAFLYDGTNTLSMFGRDTRSTVLTRYFEAWPVKPGGGAWTWSALDGIQVGVENRSTNQTNVRAVVLLVAARPAVIIENVPMATRRYRQRRSTSKGRATITMAS